MPDIREIIDNKKRIISEAEDQLNHLMEQMSCVRAENESAITERQNLARKLEMKKNEVARKENQLSDLRSKLKKEMSERDNFDDDSSKFINAESEFDSMISEHTDILVQIQVKETTATSLEMRIMKLKNDINVATNRLSLAKEKADKLTKDLEELRNASDEQPVQEGGDEDPHTLRRELDERLRDLDVLNDDLVRKINLKNSQRSTIEKSLKSIQAQIDKLQAEKKAFEEELLS